MGLASRCSPVASIVARVVMKRVPVDLVILTLTQSGLHVTARQIRNWRFRGHITRTAEGYDLAEILAYVRGRADLRAVVDAVQAG
jgi:hypothetical protein